MRLQVDPQIYFDVKKNSKNYPLMYIAGIHLMPDTSHLYY